ncbi:kinase-like protein [Ceratobasidium sp. AG-I]|nr:kinase-like protein [Ceratobasidium sp. AG-I]
MLEMEKKSSVNWGDEPAADTQQERYQHNVATIDHTMSLSEVTQHLVNRACPDITQNIDLQRCTRSPIAGGGFGDIYRGSLVDGTEVAIKCSRVFVGSDDESQKKLKRAARELYAWSKFKHENVLDLLGLALFRGEIAMVSPWMENGDIIAYLLKKPDSNRYSLSGQVAEGLVYLHKLGTIHGDLKGLNVLVAHDGTAKLTDFGNVVSEHHSLRFTTTKANPSHSLRWTAPELLLDEGTFSIKADVYALGMTILEIITGKPPYSGKTDPAVIVFVTLKKKTPARPEDCIPSNSIQGDRLWTTLTLCWSPDPEARPEAAEIRDVVSDFNERFSHDSQDNLV